MSKTYMRRGSLLLAAAILCSCLFTGVNAEAASTMTDAEIRELFNESCWDLSTGVTIGTSYVCQFHSNGTLSYIRAGYESGTANWSWSGGILTVYNLGFGEWEQYKPDNRGGFSSEPKTIQGAPGCVMSVSPDPYNIYIEYTMPKINVCVNGELVKWTDAKPFIENGRTMVPLRATAEAMVLNVIWNAQTSTATFCEFDFYEYWQRMNFQPGKTTATVEVLYYDTVIRTETVQMDVPVINRNGRLYAPIRYLAEAFGCKVTWNGATSTAYINW